ncbi:TrfB-related DNA-binding protein [Acinetobacter baumannii]|uniref:TrfB-related DNA-binding protein n=1 Tax=Acinetobacter baumannii TaxID=470 RepID=UPI000DF163A5|nr:TrfB-related DNA-binding protein [Acinetobacter baumannii]RCT89702.1 hypothetical protein DVA68_16020 [Acinetobacter baumannii]
MAGKGKSKYKSIYSLEEWEKHLDQLADFTKDRVDACKRVMVLGESPTAVAKSTGYSRQWLTEALGKVYAKISSTVPSDWVPVTVVVPPALALQIRKMAEKALEHANKDLHKIEE